MQVLHFSHWGKENERNNTLSLLLFLLVMPVNFCGVWGKVPMDTIYFVSSQPGLMLLGLLNMSDIGGFSGQINPANLIL